MHTIRYASSRSEVWRGYWRAWAKPQGLWRFHVAISAVLAASFAGVGLYPSFVLSSFVMAFAVSMALCLLLMPLWPQIRFKSSTRTLTIDASGINSCIGKRSAFRKWSEVSTIVDNGEEIVVTGKNRNAFIIPRRAFQTQAARREFFRDAKAWHSQSAA